MAGYKVSGTFNTYLSSMSTDGYITRSVGHIALTLNGRKFAQKINTPNTLSALHQMIFRTVKKSPLIKILNVIIQNKMPIRTSELAESCGYTVSGTFNTYLSELSSLGLILRTSGLNAPADILFPKGLA